MNIYFVKLDCRRSGWDYYDCAVIVAKDQAQAEEFAPNDLRGCPCVLVGVLTDETIAPGVLCGSFNAG